MFNQIYRAEGWKGLTRGIIPRVIKVAPACAIMISSYEIGKMYFADRLQHS
jgi:solute carrier family 25 protein 39/40